MQLLQWFSFQMPPALSVEFGWLDEMWGLLLAAPRKCTPGFNSRREWKAAISWTCLLSKEKSFNSQDTLAAESFAGKEIIRLKKIWLDLEEIIIFLAHEGKKSKRCKGRPSTWTPGLCSWLGFVTLGKTFWAWAKLCFDGLSSFPEPLSIFLFVQRC